MQVPVAEVTAQAIPAIGCENATFNRARHCGTISH